MSATLPEHPPVLVLGTAMWGWTTVRENAFALLDLWYDQGFRAVDAATNYPIDKDPAHFRLAENILLEWIEAHGVTDLQVMMKIGSVNNLYTPEHILTKSFWLMMLDEYQYLFGKNLDTLMVHWDNRNSEEEIRETMEAMAITQRSGLRLGLSGIKHPEIYAAINETFKFDLRIQIKHNVLHSDYRRYTSFHNKRRFIAYGINAGGLKLDPAEYGENSSLKARGGDLAKEPPVVQKIRGLIKEENTRNGRPPITAFHQIGMIYAFYHADMQGILLGVSKAAQLTSSMAFYNMLREFDYSDVSERLSMLAG